MSRHIRFGAGVFLVLLATLSLPSLAVAGALNGHANAYSGWTGSTSFASGTLAGYVDFAVFSPGMFPYGGYSPTAGEMTYAYQVFVTGSAPLATLVVLLENQADNAGWFSDLAGDTPTAAVLTPLDNVRWSFSGILQGDNSIGLAFSSTRTPMWLFGSVLDTGQSGYVIPLPSPSEIQIPEPGTSVILLALGLPWLRRRSG